MVRLTVRRMIALDVSDEDADYEPPARRASHNGNDHSNFLVSVVRLIYLGLFVSSCNTVPWCRWSWRQARWTDEVDGVAEGVVDGVVDGVVEGVMDGVVEGAVKLEP